MLAMTDAAAEAITALTDQDGQGSAGLRFVMNTEDESGAQLTLSIAPQPESDDQVVAAETGARIFLDPQAAVLLDDKVLDVQPDEQGEVSFSVWDQAESS